MDTNTPPAASAAGDTTPPTNSAPGDAPPPLPAPTEIEQAQAVTIVSLKHEVSALTTELDEANQQIKALENRPVFPDGIREIVAACPLEKLKALYQAGDLIRQLVNERWQKQPE